MTENKRTTVEAYVTGMQEFCSAMRSVVTLSTTMLVFPLTFLTAINSSTGFDPHWSLIVAWVCLGLSILSGIAFQSIAATKIFRKLHSSSVPAWVDYPDLAYWLAMIALVAGLGFLVFGLIVTGL